MVEIHLWRGGFPDEPLPQKLLILAFGTSRTGSILSIHTLVSAILDGAFKSLHVMNSANVVKLGDDYFVILMPASWSK